MKNNDMCSCVLKDTRLQSILYSTVLPQISIFGGKIMAIRKL